MGQRPLRGEGLDWMDRVIGRAAVLGFVKDEGQVKEVGECWSPTTYKFLAGQRRPWLKTGLWFCDRR